MLYALARGKRVRIYEAEQLMKRDTAEEVMPLTGQELDDAFWEGTT